MKIKKKIINNLPNKNKIQRNRNRLYKFNKKQLQNRTILKQLKNGQINNGSNQQQDKILQNSSPNVTNNNNNNSPSISTGTPTTVSTKKKKRNNKKINKSLSSPSPTTNNNRKQNLLKSSSNKKKLNKSKNNLLHRKSVQNQKKETAKKQLIYQNMTSTPKILFSNNKHELNQEELDCVLIQESEEIIVIDDDDDEENTDTASKNISKLSITNIPNNNGNSNILKDKQIRTSNLNNITNSQSSESNNNKEQLKITVNKCPEVNQVKNSTEVKNNIELTPANEKIENRNDIKGLQKNFDKVTNELPEYSKLYETILSDESFDTESSLIQHNNDYNNDKNNSTIICLDDTIRNKSTIISNIRRSSVQRNDDTELDDSIIFVSESIDLDKFQPSTSSTALDYIPLSMDTPSDYSNLLKKHKLDVIKENHFKKMKTNFSPLTKRIGGDLFTASEHKKILSYNTNTYNPNKESDDKQPKTGKRMVLIDGSNVAFQHALNKTFSVKGLQICIEYFEKMSYDVKAIVPQFRLQKYKSTEPEKLEKLHSDGKIVFTPCKNLPGKCSSSYDDRFLLQLATELDAAIVSNDNYRDLINENPAFKKIIENRVIGYTWCNDLFILPKDPYGRLGPTLSTILNRI